MLQHTERPLALIHALWTLEGLGALTANDIEPLLKQQNEMFRAQAMAALPSVLNKTNQANIIKILEGFLNDSADATRAAMLLGKIQRVNPGGALELQEQLLKKYPANVFIADAIISTVENREDQLKKQLINDKDTGLIIYQRLEKVRKDIVNKQNARRTDGLMKLYPRGGKVFTTICQTCHGKDGEGIQSLAPPLNRSNWVTGNPDNLTRIVLFGLTGPVEVNGKVYKSPEINGDMPGIGSNDEFNDEDIAQLLSFIRNAWGNKASDIPVKELQKIRQQYKGRVKPFTMEELKQTK
jgi:mono/diheme cytochrome c family protein